MFRPQSAMSNSGMGGGSQDSGPAQEEAGNNAYQMKQEQVDSGSSPKTSHLTDSQNSVKSEGQGSDAAGGREEVPVRAASSPSQILPGPASMQSSVTDSETIKSEQEHNAAAESSQENKVVLTGRDGKTPKMVSMVDHYCNAVDWSFDWLIDWLITQKFFRLIYSWWMFAVKRIILIGFPSIDWLIDWLIERMKNSSHIFSRVQVHSQQELQELLLPLLDQLFYQEPEGPVFREPVDPITLHIPDYFDIVKTPMDLSTIRKKLEGGNYDDPWQFVDDVQLMFNNAWLYNRKGSRVYKFATKVCFHVNFQVTVFSVCYVGLAFPFFFWFRIYAAGICTWQNYLTGQSIDWLIDR